MTKDFMLIHIEGLLLIFVANDLTVNKTMVQSEKEMEGLKLYEWYTLNITDETTTTA